jgi:hypothetical protein
MHLLVCGRPFCRRLDLKAGTVYPILMRVAERGQVETAWETDPPAVTAGTSWRGLASGLCRTHKQMERARSSGQRHGGERLEVRLSQRAQLRVASVSEWTPRPVIDLGDGAEGTI